MQILDVKKFTNLKSRLGVRGASGYTLSLFVNFLIEKGAGERFVPIPYKEIEDSLGINPTTAHIIKEGLERAGILETKKGTGWSKDGPRPTEWKLNIYKLLAEMGRRVASFETEDYSVAVVEDDDRYLVLRNGNKEGEFETLAAALALFYELCHAELRRKVRDESGG